MNGKPLSTGELASFYGVTTRTIGHWCDVGGLPHFHLPSMLANRRIPVDDFVAWARKNELPVPAALAGPVLVASADPAVREQIGRMGDDVRTVADWPTLAAASVHSARGLVLDVALGWEESKRFVSAFASLSKEGRCPVVCLVRDADLRDAPSTWGAARAILWPDGVEQLRRLFW